MCANTKNTQKSGEGGRAARKSDRSGVILEQFRSFPNKKFTIKNLAAASGGSDREGRFRTNEVVRNLLEQGVIEEVSAGKFCLIPSQLPTVEGVVDMLASGSAYVKVDGQDKDIFIDKRHTNHALDRDVVRVAVTGKKTTGAKEGVIAEIVRRADRNYVGRVEVTRNHAFVRVDTRKMPYDIFLYTKDTQVKDGDKVVVRIKEWPSDTKSPTGEIVEILGQAGDNDTEMHAILAEYNLPYSFEEDVERSAEKISAEITEQDYAQRRDMRNVTTFTIDPADAKDFDDALSIRSVGEGRWEIGVHIADVTHYVLPDTIVEDEAKERATSVYLVDRTIPMLPERLSNFLCSLRPDEEKLCFSAIFEMDADANIRKQWLGRTVIKSDRRFTYEEAQKVIETGEGDFKEEILTLNELAQKMRAARFKNGAISFEREEAKFVIDEKGKPLGVYFKVQKEANQLIEEFMLLANRRVAEFVGQKRGEGANAERTFVYRVHDKPDTDKLERFSRFISKFGYSFNYMQSRKISSQMNSLMSEIKGRAEENVISTLAIRTMAKAYYSTDNIGHYGLAFPYYTHFTSPIRRYPDMMVHRLLARYLAGGRSADKDYYEELCMHSSDMEVRAAEAERSSIKYKMVEYMTERVGQEFEGTVTGVTEWGVYVELKETHIEGMVSLSDMGDDYYMFDEENYAVRGERTHRTITLGDDVVIRVKRADLQHKQLDYELVATIDFKTGKRHPFELCDVRHDSSSGRSKKGDESAAKGGREQKRRRRR